MKILPYPITPFSALRTLALAGVTALALTGCMTQEDSATDDSSDGQGAFLVSELDQMGQSLGEPAGEALATAGADTFTITGELVIDPFKYQADCACFVRKAKYVGQQGFERERLDSVTFLDSAGKTMDVFRPGKAAKILYRRDVERVRGAREVDVRLDITIDMKVEDGRKVGVWNGTLTGTLDGQVIKSGTLSNVVRPFVAGRFRFPEAGTVEMARPRFHVRVEFLGDGKAKVTLKNLRSGHIHVLWVDKDYKESDPVAQD